MKRAQAVMEFLMMYGWAILLLLAAVAFLNYFGLFDLNKVSANSVIIFDPGLVEGEHMFNSSGLYLSIQNAFPFGLSELNLTLNTTGASTVQCNQQRAFGSIPSGGKSPLYEICTFSTPPPPEASLVANIYVTYRQEGKQTSRQTKGELKLRRE
ncbi:hypothetical protein D6783_02785 [Candidatus Woesearchaeota archaeon]|nr:MAG: hypothetical protein D6783_02785 [Candidatus Woesearchaeota archaeon]